MPRLIAAVVAVAVALVCAASVALVPVTHLVLDASTANPSVGECRAGERTGGIIGVVTVDDNGAHAVTVQSRACATCTWVTESPVGAVATPTVPYQFRVPYVEAVRVSVANSGADAVGFACTVY